MLPHFGTAANNLAYRDFVSIRSSQTFSAPCEGRGTVRKDGGGVVALLKADSTAIKESLLWLYVTQFSPTLLRREPPPGGGHWYKPPFDLCIKSRFGSRADKLTLPSSVPKISSVVNSICTDATSPKTASRCQWRHWFLHIRRGALRAPACKQKNQSIHHVNKKPSDLFVGECLRNP